MTPASLLAALLSLSPPAALAFEPPAGEAGEAPPPKLDGDEAGYAEALAKVREALNKANEDPAFGAAPLRDALAVLRQYAPRLATDIEGQELRTTAQLSLARALLAAGDADGARDAMDEAIRTSRGDPLPTKNFGPGLAALHRERDGVLGKQGAGVLEIDCRVPCRVFVNERPAGQRIDALVPGSYRVWIEASDGSEAPVDKLVTVERDGVAELGFGTRKIDEDPRPPTRETKPRLLPRWADVLIMSAGVAAIGTGAALWAIDGRCPGGADPNDTEACPQVYITRTAGIATVAVGGAVLLTGTVLLSVDEVRTADNRRAQAVTLSWQMRF